MSTSPLRLPVALPSVSRSERGRVPAGVCSGIGDGLGVDPTLVRLTFALLAFASGAGIVAYLALWALLPAPGESCVSRRRKIAGAVMLVWAAFLALRGLGLSGTLVWPLALVAAGLVLAGGAAALGLREQTGRILAAILIFAGVVVFLGENTRGSATTLLAPGAVAVALLLVLGPWALRLARERDAERAERIRTQEREELAARVHDSVLQTLALIQREPNDPAGSRRSPGARSASCARGSTRAASGGATGRRTFADEAAAEIEEMHGVGVDLVVVGDAPMDDPTSALVLAAGRQPQCRQIPAAPTSPYSSRRPRDVACSCATRHGFRPRLGRPPTAGDRGVDSARMARVGGTARSSRRRAPGPSGVRILPEATGEQAAGRIVVVDDHDLFRAGVRGELGTRWRSSGRRRGAAAVPLIKEPTRRGAARRPHAPRRGSGGDLQAVTERPGSTSSPCRCPTRPRTSSV